MKHGAWWGIVRTTITSRHEMFLTADRNFPTSRHFLLLYKHQSHAYAHTRYAARLNDPACNTAMLPHNHLATLCRGMPYHHLAARPLQRPISSSSSSLYIRRDVGCEPLPGDQRVSASNCIHYTQLYALL